jgi:hypothetical protein
LQSNLSKNTGIVQTTSQTMAAPSSVNNASSPFTTPLSRSPERAASKMLELMIKPGE